MKWIKKVALFLIFIMFIGFTISGCAMRRTPNPTPRQDINTPRTNTPKTDQDMIPNGNYSPGRLKTPVTTTDNIAKAVQTVPGVKGASVVVSGNSAYVGINIDIKGNMDNTSKIQNLKKQTADMVRKTDSNIKTVYVSADADFIQRVNRISNDIRNGKPVEGFRDELDELVNRITPEKQ